MMFPNASKGFMPFVPNTKEEKRKVEEEYRNRQLEKHRRSLGHSVPDTRMRNLYDNSYSFSRSVPGPRSTRSSSNTELELGVSSPGSDFAGGSSVFSRVIGIFKRSKSRPDSHATSCSPSASQIPSILSTSPNRHVYTQRSSIEKRQVRFAHDEGVSVSPSEEDLRMEQLAQDSIESFGSTSTAASPVSEDDISLPLTRDGTGGSSQTLFPKTTANGASRPPSGIVHRPSVVPVLTPTR